MLKEQKSKNANIAAAILSGGKNSRMGGRNKAFIEINGKRILDNSLEKLDTIFNQLIIVTNSPESYLEYADKCLIVSDVIKEVGPLGGIHAALSSTEKKSVFFMACDMPNLHNEFIFALIDKFTSGEYDAVIAKGPNGVEPLFGVYDISLIKNIEEYIYKGKSYSIRKFLDTINVLYVDIENNESFCNLNTQEEIDKYENKI